MPVALCDTNAEQNATFLNFRSESGTQAAEVLQ
jgi:hypothetical protein